MSTQFKTRKQLIEKADIIIKYAEYSESEGWNLHIENEDKIESDLYGVKVFNVGNSYGIYGMNAGLYELELSDGSVLMGAVPERNSLLFLLG